ncbi:hypothetical protein [Halorussus ruber]|nr:hypothetical protein [Halorussus ruber]
MGDSRPTVPDDRDSRPDYRESYPDQTTVGGMKGPVGRVYVVV